MGLIGLQITLFHRLQKVISGGVLNSCSICMCFHLVPPTCVDNSVVVLCQEKRGPRSSTDPLSNTFDPVSTNVEQFRRHAMHND